MTNNKIEYNRYLPLINEDYKFCVKSSGLKGLLKPFKGKRELETLNTSIIFAREQITLLQNQLLKSTQSYPLKYLPIKLRDYKFVLRSINSQTNLLRWRTIDNRSNGGETLKNYLADNDNPQHLRQLVKQVEYDRLILNMQMSLLSALAQHVSNTVSKMEQIEELGK